MSQSLIRLLRQYEYRLPSALIAQEPVRPRDRARLLVYDRRQRRTTIDSFSRLGQYLPTGSVLVLNDTKVFPARLTLRKPTGGTVRLLFVSRRSKDFVALADRRLEVGSTLTLTPRLRFVVLRQTESRYTIRPSFPLSHLPLILDEHGTTPVPPYLRRTRLSERQLRAKYQAVIARQRGSVAAPTASLHFTKSLLARLRRAGIGVETVTLHVNLGTFAPLTAKQLRAGRLHGEQYVIEAATARRLQAAKQAGRPIIAVGTTVARALEAAARGCGRLSLRHGTTGLFIRPGYRFRFVDGLITNFHVPRSSLMMLVAAMVGRSTLLRIYRRAIRRRLRFFSFGDAMFIRP